MALHILSKQLAKTIEVSGIFSKIDQFYDQAESRELLRFTFYQFYYSYPAFGKKWKSAESQYHRINTECCMCHKPTKQLNHAGVSMVFLKKAGRDRMLIFCDKCVTKCSNLLSEWEPKKIISKQLQLF